MTETKPTGTKTHAPSIWRHILARPRLLMSILLGISVFILLPGDKRLATRILIGWNSAAGLYILLALLMMLRASHQSMRRRATLGDESRYVVLGLSVISAIASMVAIVAELVSVKGTTETLQWLHLTLSGLTILTAWTFIHIIFTQHYAHEYYAERKTLADGRCVHGCGLTFPDTETPNYLDFLYFAFTIGVASQTADVSISSPGMRKVVLIHSVLSYFFNTTILALTINIASGLI